MVVFPSTLCKHLREGGRMSAGNGAERHNAQRRNQIDVLWDEFAELHGEDAGIEVSLEPAQPEQGPVSGAPSDDGPDDDAIDAADRGGPLYWALWSRLHGLAGDGRTALCLS